MRSNIVDLELVWHHETERAVLVARDEEAEPVWLPKSQIDIDDDEPKSRGFLVVVSMPEPLAVEKELV